MLRLFMMNDLPSLARVECATQLAPWSQDIFERCFAAGSAGWVIEIEGKVIGFIVVLLQLDEAHILNLCIDPAYQHQGWGFKLLEYALADIKEAGGVFVYLEVRRSNQPAIALYKKMGFKQIGERRGYYMQPQQEDALVFAMDFASE